MKPLQLHEKCQTSAVFRQSTVSLHLQGNLIVDRPTEERKSFHLPCQGTLCFSMYSSAEPATAFFLAAASSLGLCKDS